MPSIQWNRNWNDYAWPEHGDEWSGQAAYCGQPYPAWKESVHEAFLRPYLRPSAVALEVAPGHGRWTEFLVRHAAHVHLVDLNPSCIEYCRRRFAAHRHLSYAVTDGQSLPGVAAGAVDFAWSFDSFVHMEADVIGAYLREFARVLRPGGHAVIHHAGRRHGALAFGFLAGLGRPGRALFQRLSMKRDTAGGGDGRRSRVSAALVARLVRAAGLELVFQVDSWGERGQFGCKRYNDVLSGMRKPPG